MAYSEGLAERIRPILDEYGNWIEKKMFVGLCFMVNQHMCVGILGEQLMARVGKPSYEDALKQAFVHKMDFTGKAMTGYVLIDQDGLASDKQLRDWINQCLDFVLTLPDK